MWKLRISSITSTIALAAIPIVSLTSSGNNFIDFQALESQRFAIYDSYVTNTNSSNDSVISFNSSISSLERGIVKSPVLINEIAEIFFGEMRFLTPEENERKIKMYKKMSTVVSGVNFFDWLC